MIGISITVGLLVLVTFICGYAIGRASLIPVDEEIE